MFTLAIAVALGAIVVGTIGFLGSGEKFEVRKYLATVLTGIISGVGVVLLFSDVVVTERLIVLAFAAGAGVDSAKTAISNAIAARANGKPSP